MYNQDKVKIVRIGVLILVCFVSLLVGGTVGYFLHSPSPTTQTQTEEVVQESRLTQDVVKEFLITYYTKKDLGENRDRYKDLMTDQMYRQKVDEEESPVYQAYKGYILNQVYDKAKIYIDEETLTVLADVEYHNLQTTKRNNPENGVTMYEKATVKLQFVKQGDQYLVNRIEHLEAKIDRSEFTNTGRVSEETSQETTTTTQTTPSTTEVQEEEPEESTTTTTKTLRGRLW